MPRVLISEPSPELLGLYEIVAARIGHEPVAVPTGAPEVPAGDLALIEPGTPSGLALATRLRAASPTLPLVFVSIYPRSADAVALEPDAYLQKPFHVSELEHALRAAAARLAVPTTG